MDLIALTVWGVVAALLLIFVILKWGGPEMIDNVKEILRIIFRR